MKRICAVLLVLCLAVMNIQPVNLQASEEVSKDRVSGINVLTIANEKELKENYEELNTTEVVRISQNTLEQLELDEVKEVLDNGTDILVYDSDVETVENLFEVSSSAQEEGEESTSVYLTTENSEYQVLPVYPHVIYEEDRNVTENEKAKDLMALLEYLKHSEEDSVIEESIATAGEVYKIVHEKRYDELLTQMTEDEVVSLQTSTMIGDSFTENSCFYYFYKEGSANGTGTDYDYSSSSNKPGWSKMGSLSLALYGLKIKTISETTFDNVYSVVVASGINDKHVKQFTVNLNVPDVTSNIILDKTVSTGGATSSNGKIATAVNASGAIPSTGYTTYAYNPGSQSVSTNFSQKYTKSWTFTPAKVQDNGSWRVRPAITLKKTNGTKSSVTASVSVDYFQVSGGVRNYTIKDTVKCTIKFVNHQKA